MLIEDDPGTGAAVQKVLTTEGFAVESVRRGEEGLQRATTSRYDLVITDFKLPGISGLDLIKQLHQSAPKLPIIMMTAHGSTETAIEATKLGAYEYLTKPFEADELLDLVAEALRNSELMFVEIGIGEPGGKSNALIGNSKTMQEVYKSIGRVASTPVPVLIRGETGTGKELVARAIYQHSNRAGKAFIAVNCAAIPKDLLESELFGHERGAFTGAVSRRVGKFEQANGGTIFLDEIGDLHADTQAKLLRVLQEQSFQRVGGDENLQVDVRILTATHRDLEAMIGDEFREDLFYRLSVVTIKLPPLRERAEDIPDLVRFLLRKHGADLGVELPSIQPEAINLLQAQSWPGNVRELENSVREALLLARPLGIAAHHITQILQQRTNRKPLAGQTHSEYIAALLARAARGEEQDVFAKLIADLEPELYSQAIKLAQGNQAKAARWLGVTRQKMREKLTALGLHPSNG